MRKASFSIALGVALALGAVAGPGVTAEARAELPANLQTINVYSSSFSPSMMWDASGVVVTLVNRDWIPHRIVLYRSYTLTSFDVTLEPGQRYTVPEPLTCSGSCYNAPYAFVDADRSVVYDGYCSSFCARLWIYNNGT
jgi:hypothetical protein